PVTSTERRSAKATSCDKWLRRRRCFCLVGRNMGESGQSWIDSLDSPRHVLIAGKSLLATQVVPANWLVYGEDQTVAASTVNASLPGDGRTNDRHLCALQSMRGSLALPSATSVAGSGLDPGQGRGMDYKGCDNTRTAMVVNRIWLAQWRRQRE